MVHDIRREVFIEEQGVPEEIEMDDKDDEAIHVLAVVDDEPAGCGRILLTAAMPGSAGSQSGKKCADPA